MQFSIFNSHYRIPLLHWNRFCINISHTREHNAWWFLKNQNLKILNLKFEIGIKIPIHIFEFSHFIESICWLTFSIVELQLQSSINARPMSMARSADIWLQGAFNVPDWIIPRVASPFVTGDNRCKLTALPPADSPNNVIRSGLPPNALALSFNQRIASAWSHNATLPDQIYKAKWKRKEMHKNVRRTTRRFKRHELSQLAKCNVKQKWIWKCLIICGKSWLIKDQSFA